MENPAGSQCSEADLREAALQLAADLRDEFRNIKRPSFAAQVDRIRDALAGSDATRAVAIWEELVPKIAAAGPRRRMSGIDLLAGTLAGVLSEMTGSQVAAPDFDIPVPPSSLGTAVKRCILVLVGAACLAFGITILRLPEREPDQEIFRIAVGVLFIIGGPVLLIKGPVGDRGQIETDFWKLLDGF